MVAQREQRALASQLKKLDMQRTSPKLRCTWHCFCVAFKALSGGLVLLIVGTIMSVSGFMMEAEQREKAKTNPSSTMPSKESDEVNARIRNLTYAGPVLCGLGGIVIVAALVLTFEVRDTLGVKEPPGQGKGNILVEKKQQPKAPISVESKAQTSNVDVRNVAASSNDGRPDSTNGGKQIETAQARPQSSGPERTEEKVELGQFSNTGSEINMQVCTIESELRKLSNSGKGISRAKTPPDTLQLTKVNNLEGVETERTDRIGRQGQRPSRQRPSSAATHRKRTHESSLPLGGRKELKLAKSDHHILETNLDQLGRDSKVLTTEHAPVSDRHLSMSFSLDSTNLTTTDRQQVERLYFEGLRSPQDTELSDTEEPSELCSLSLPLNRPAAAKEGRCSFTASPEEEFSGKIDRLASEPSIRKASKADKPKRASFASSELSYHFLEQQKMQQQLIAQQQMLLQQQQQLTNLLEAKFSPHSMSSSSAPLAKQPLSFEPTTSFSFDQATKSKFEKTKSLDKPSIKSLPIGSPSSVEPFDRAAFALHQSDSIERRLDQASGISNDPEQPGPARERRSVASFESDGLSEQGPPQRPTASQQIASLNRTKKRTSSACSSKPSASRAKAASSQSLEFNINMSECKEEIKNLIDSSINLSRGS